ncbi:MAG: energy transducer TonB, partial [Methylomonas sp.]
FAKFVPAGDLSWDSSGALALQPSAPGFSSAQVGRVLKNFKYVGEDHDRKLTDYLLLGLLSVLVHTTVVDHFDRLALEEEVIEPAKPETKVQITLTRPQLKPVPPPPPQVKPQPPKPKVVPLKPQKPKPVPKVVDEAPTPDPRPVISDAPTAPVSASPAPPAPVVEEKITAPIAGADYLNNPAPEYPEIAQERGWEGKVLMKVHVQPNGKPDNIAVIKSSGQQVLDDAAVKTVYKWSFVPAKRGDTPIAGFVTVPITFNLS